MKAKNFKNQASLADLTTKLSITEMENVNGGKRKPLIDIPICIGTYCFWPTWP